MQYIGEGEEKHCESLEKETENFLSMSHPQNLLIQ